MDIAMNAGEEELYLGNQPRVRPSKTTFFKRASRNPSLEKEPEFRKFMTMDVDVSHASMTEEQKKKVRILEQFGFDKNSQTVKATLQNLYPVHPQDKYRTSCFRSEKERVASYRERVKQSMGIVAKQDSERLKKYTGEEIYQPFYKDLEPQIPYPHKNKRVLPHGFVRDRPELFERVLTRFKKWHDKRKDMGLASLKIYQQEDRTSQAPNEGEPLSQTESPAKVMSPDELPGSAKSMQRRSTKVPAQLSLIRALSRQKSLDKTTRPMLRKGTGVVNLLKLDSQQKSSEAPTVVKVGQFKETFFFNQMKTRGHTVISESPHISMIMKSDSPDCTSQRNPYRLSLQAANYDFAHRPFEEKAIKAKKEREQLQRQETGITGDPRRSEDRYINKIFDHGRAKQIEMEGTIGCDIDYSTRNKLMKVGQIPRGGLGYLREEVAQETQKILNINPDSKRERIMQANMVNRGRTDTAFEGDNHFHNLTKIRRERRRNFSELMRYDDIFVKQGPQDQQSFSSSKKHYFSRVTQAQKGQVRPVLASTENLKGTGSKITNYSQFIDAALNDSEIVNLSIHDHRGGKDELDHSPITDQKGLVQQPSFGSSQPTAADHERNLRFQSDLKQRSVGPGDSSAGPQECSTPSRLEHLTLSRNPTIYENQPERKQKREGQSIEAYERMVYRSQNFRAGPVNKSIVIRESLSTLNHSNIVDGTNTGTAYQQSDLGSPSKGTWIRTSREGAMKTGMSIMDKNGSKIKHGSYFVSIQEPNEHNVKEIYPKSFPLRHDINFIALNKTKQQTHVFEQESESQITLASETMRRLQKTQQQ